ncbi:MAG TPA: VCBS repeat-containing protein [Chitinophagaceae bacterium]|nr:VCBS repeat-containing protein [Chitinophagaceae bacterium]
MLSLIFYLTILLPFKAAPQPTFEPQTIDENISIGYGLATGDVDGDGKPDILLADKKQFVWYRNGDWKKFLLAENLTDHDNVCIAARDIDGDGKVEVTVGAEWNPGETKNADESGAVYFLVRPANATQLWTPVKLYHEPTIHRMQWYKSSAGKYFLIVVPLHGIGNKDGTGTGVNALIYEYPADVNAEWRTYKLNTGMHLTHNFEIAESSDKNKSGFYIAGKEGIKFISEISFTQTNPDIEKLQGMDSAAGEVRITKGSKENFIASIEPMHGTNVVTYLKDEAMKRIVLDDNVKEGHALAVADFLNTGSAQVVAGWRAPNKDSIVGIKLYIKKSDAAAEWRWYWIDKNGMACEDIKVADLDVDGRPDIIASGRATHNLKIYWNRGYK